MAAVAPAPKPRRKSSQRRKEEHFWIIPEVVDEIKVNRETGVAQVYRQWRQGRYLGKVCMRRAPLPLPLLLFYTYANTLLPPPPSSSSSFARALRSSGWFCQVLCFYGGHEQQRAGGKGRAEDQAEAEAREGEDDC